MADDESVLLESRDDRGVLTLTLNRGKARNALNPDLLDALRDALTRAAGDEGVRVVVLTGAAPAFCAGGDVRAMVTRRGDAAGTHRVQREKFAPLATALLRYPKPVVARVNGDAMGAGLMLAASADYAIAADSARCGLAFARVALVPDMAGTWLLPRLVGLRKAREITLLPDAFPAEEAARIGLVTEAVPDAELDARVDAIAGRLAEGPTRALGLARRALADATALPLDAALEREAELQGLCFTLADHAEGVDAFLEKRPAAFTGR